MDRSFFTAPRYEPYRQPGNVKVPFWLQPDKHYVGPAWYERDVVVPPEWKGRRVVLHLERPHWQTIAWLDGRVTGSSDSLSTPHEHDLGTVEPGKHRLTIRVDNRLVVDVGLNSHSVTDHTQSNWNGIVGRMELRPAARVWIEDLQVHPRVASRSAVVRGRIGNATGGPGRGTLRLEVSAGEGAAVAPKASDVSWEASGGTFEVEVPLGASAPLWDEFSPALHRLSATLEAGEARDTRTVRFGLREIGTQGTQFVVNGRKAFFRGTLECAIFPKTGHPPTDVDSWRRIVRIAKAHGLNMIRFHSWCPPEAAFTAADEEGFYYQVEVASWANSSTRLGAGLPIDEWLYRETARILKAYGNHPSFVLLPYGNEPAGRDAEFLGRWVEHWKALDPRRLYTSASGWPQIPENQFHVAPDPRIQAWGQGLASRVNAKPPETRTDYRDYVRARPVPVISHEIGQWCAYPNLAERSKYTGYLKAKNFDIFADTLAASGMADQAAAFLHASGKLQSLLYKEDIESALRTPGMGGFQLLDLHDFPGQGTALVGVLDPFWDSKGYVTAEAFQRFSGPTVPLARLDRRVFTTAETLEADLEVAHFGPKPLAGARPVWRLVGEDGRAVARGTLPARDVPVDNGIALGRVSVSLAKLAAPRKYRLVVGIEGTPFENDWDVWVYPPRVDTAVPAGVDGRARARCRDGGAAARRRPGRPPRPARPGARGRPGKGRARLLEHLLEHRLDEPPGAPHPRRPPRPEAPGARRLPDRGLQQLAVVAPREPRGGDDPRRPAEGAPSHGAGDRRLVHEPAARPRPRGAGGEGPAPRHEHRPRERPRREPGRPPDAPQPPALRRERPLRPASRGRCRRHPRPRPVGCHSEGLHWDGLSFRGTPLGRVPRNPQSQRQQDCGFLVARRGRSSSE